MMKWWNYFSVPTFPECTSSPLPQTLQNGQRNRAEVRKTYYQNNKEMLAWRFLALLYPSVKFLAADLLQDISDVM